jgi:hypothetical protein
MNGWQITGICAGVVGATVAVARYLLPAKLKGRVLNLRLEADIADALDGSDRMWLVASVLVYNDRAKPTGITGWKLGMEFRDGTRRAISGGPLTEAYWEKLMGPHQPQKRAFLQFAGVRFEHGTPHEGWIGFPCRPGDSDALRFTVVAVESTGKEHALETYERAVDAAA